MGMSMQDALKSMERSAFNESVSVINPKSDWIVKCTDRTKHSFDCVVDTEDGSYPFYTVNGKVWYPKDYTANTYYNTSKYFKGLKKPLLFGNKKTFVGNEYTVKATPATQTVTLRIDRALIRINADKNDFLTAYGDIQVALNWDYIDPVAFYEVLKGSKTDKKTNVTLMSTNDLAHILKNWIDNVALKFAAAKYKTIKGENIKSISHPSDSKKTPAASLYYDLIAYFTRELPSEVAKFGFTAKSPKKIITVTEIDPLMELLHKSGLK